MNRIALSQTAVLRTLHFLSYGMQALLTSYFPIYFDDLGFSKLQIGAVYSIGPVVSIFSNLLLGLAGDRTKGLRRILQLLFLGQIAAMAGLLPQREFTAIAVLMGLYYFFQTPVVPTMDSLTLLAAAQMKRSYAAIRMFGSLGFAATGVIVGYLINRTGSVLSLYLGIAMITTALVCSMALVNMQASLRKFDFGGLLAILKRRDTILFFALIALISVAHRMVEGFLSVSLREAGADDSLIGYAWLGSSISEIPMFFALAKYGHRFRELPLLAVAATFYFIRLGLVSLLHDPRAMVATQLMHSVTFGIYYITSLRYLQQLLPDEYRASGQALFTIVWSGFGGLGAGALGGLLFDAYGYEAPFRLGALFGLAAAAGFLYAHFRRAA
jgi:PPP family 3-phenylpropionic acid transporter